MLCIGKEWSSQNIVTVMTRHFSYSVIAYFLKKEISCQIKLFLRRIAVCNQTQGKIPEISITITYDTQYKLSTRKNKDDSAK